jgi:hypothetical protein
MPFERNIFLLLLKHRRFSVLYQLQGFLLIYMYVPVNHSGFNYSCLYIWVMLCSHDPERDLGILMRSVTKYCP